MIISDKHKYVYIGISRTGSKSMIHWLIEHFDGRWGAGHHDYHVPDEAADYFIFTLVRNPYDRAASGHFAVHWEEQEWPTEEDIGPCASEPERARKWRAHFKAREGQQQKKMPQQSTIPVDQRIREAALRNESEDYGINQKRYTDRGKVNLVLYYERLPQCLAELPFVDPNNIPLFPHHPEKGIRPPGNFFDFFAGTDEEQSVWAYAAEDFEAFGYRRYDCGLPADAPNALRMR